MLCRDLMKTNVFTCKQSDTAAECARIMRRHNIGFVPVTDDEGRFVGTVTDRDLAVRVLADARPVSTPLEDVMTREQIICRASDKLAVAETRMAEAKKSRIVVIDGQNHVIGVISLSDIGRAEKPKQAGRIFSAVVEREAPPPAAV